jgi:hypothetical protein
VTYITPPISIPDIAYTVTDPAVSTILPGFSNSNPTYSLGYRLVFANGTAINPLVMTFSYSNFNLTIKTND